MKVHWFVCLKLSVYMSKSKKVRMNYSSHGIYGGNHMVFSLFSLLSSENKPRTGGKLSTFCNFHWSQSKSLKK